MAQLDYNHALEATLAEPDATVMSGPPDARPRVRAVRYAVVGATYVVVYAALAWALPGERSAALERSNPDG